MRVKRELLEVVCLESVRGAESPTKKYRVYLASRLPQNVSELPKLFPLNTVDTQQID